MFTTDKTKAHTQAHICKNSLLREKVNLQMKKYETIKKLAETVTVDELKKIVNNENIDCETLEKKEILSVLAFDELRKALNTKECELVLDCNYAQSKSKVETVLVYKYAVVNAMIQIYYKRDLHFSVATSASKVNREQLTAIKELSFTVQYRTDKATQKQIAKKTYRESISYDEIVNVVKQVKAILENTATAQHSESTEKAQ